MIDGKQKVLALAAHISYLFFGVGYVLVPLVLYLMYDKKDDFIAGHAKQALMAQAIFGVISAIVAGLTVLLVGVAPLADCLPARCSMVLLLHNRLL